MTYEHPSDQEQDKLKRLFTEALLAKLPEASLARERLRVDASDREALETLVIFFHHIAGTASHAGLELLGAAAALAERVGAHAALDRYPDRSEAVLLVSATVDGVRAMIEAEGVTGASEPAPSSASGSTASASAVAQEKAKILVVDDDSFSARMIDSCLRAAGFACSYSSAPKQALALMAEELPDLIILDVVMPQMDGFEFCRRVRAHRAMQFTPIVFVTRQGDVEQRVKGLEVGGNDYISKPFEPQELIARVRAHLSRLAVLREMALRDGLTRCYNREYFQARLKQEVMRARRYRHALALAKVGVDRFKRVNDLHGRAVGDKVLAHLASIIAASVRAQDVVARYGGDEFAIIMVHASAEEARIVCERLRERIRDYEFRFDSESDPECGKHVSLTASIGLTEFVAKGDIPKTFIARADRALCEAKDLGRDQVEFCRSDTSATRPMAG